MLSQALIGYLIMSEISMLSQVLIGYLIMSVLKQSVENVWTNYRSALDAAAWEVQFMDPAGGN